MSQYIGISAGGTGGHIFPALAMAKLCQERGLQCVWFGIEGLEEKVALAHGIPFKSIPAPKVVGGVIGLASTSAKLAGAIYHARKALVAANISVVFSTGAYASLPTAIAAKTLGLPLVIHEQNAVMGRANKLLARIADHICLGMPIHGVKRSTLTGNPIRMSPQQSSGQSLLIMGGSQGCQFFNQAIPSMLHQLNLSIPIIHIAGKHFEAVSKEYKRLGIEAKVYEFVDHIESVYECALMAISRSGAMALAELSAYGIPSILVPYPHAQHDHQRLNATIYLNNHAALLVDEDIEALGKALLKLATSEALQKQLSNNAIRINPPHAEKRIIDIIEQYAQVISHQKA